MADQLPPWTADWWRPIETAPKNDIDVLVWDPVYECSRIAGWFVPKDYPPGKGSWCIAMSDQECEPTHWMPLPPPPSVTDAALKSHESAQMTR